VAAQGDLINLFVVDAGGGKSRIWAVGDPLTNNSTQAFAFASDATLPFNSGTPPPINVPAGNTQLFDGSGSTTNEFDARGGKVAFVSDLTMANRFDLYVADADGANPTMLVQGNTGIEISSVSISPDGTKVAFLMDSAAVDNGTDLYFVPVAGGTPTQLSPTRTTQTAAQ